MEKLYDLASIIELKSMRLKSHPAQKLSSKIGMRYYLKKMYTRENARLKKLAENKNYYR